MSGPIDISLIIEYRQQQIVKENSVSLDETYNIIT